MIIINKIIHPLKSSRISSIKNYAAVLAMGVVFLLLSYQVSFAKVAWSDEVWYVVVARNLVEHGRLSTTLYLPEAITRGGFPLRDLHLPGYMMMMALPFWLLGPTDAAALLPSQLSYLLSGVLVFWLGNRLFSAKAGYVSAGAFFVFPLVLRYTHSAMTELTLGLIALAYLAVWVKTIESPRLYQCAVLALLLFLGTLVRETFLVFSPAALVALWRWPAAQRKWAIASFLAAALFLFAGIFFPLAGHRSYYPHFWKTNLEQATIGLIISGFWDNFLLQAGRYLTRFDIFPENQIRVILSAITLVVIASFFWLKKTPKLVSAYFSFAVLSMFLFLSIFYSSSGWRGLRMLMMVLPPGLILFNGILLQLPRRRLAYSLIAVELTLFAFFAWHATVDHTRERAEFYNEQQPYSNIIQAQLNPYHPQVVMGHKPWLYALESFPVNVIWRLPDNLQTLRQIQQVVQIDAIVADNAARKDQLLEAAATGKIDGNFRLINREPIDGYFFLVRGDLTKQPLNVTFGPDLRLLGLDTAHAVKAGAPLPLTLVWQARAAITADYATAVRLLNQQQQEAQYWLGRPALSSRPTPGWQPGEVVIDTWDITVGPQLAPGAYNLEIEIYNTATGQSMGKTTPGSIIIEPAYQ